VLLAVTGRQGNGDGGKQEAASEDEVACLRYTLGNRLHCGAWRSQLSSSHRMHELQDCNIVQSHHTLDPETLATHIQSTVQDCLHLCNTGKDAMNVFKAIAALAYNIAFAMPAVVVAPLPFSLGFAGRAPHRSTCSGRRRASGS
jgi:hypothetical protein